MSSDPKSWMWAQAKTILDQAERIEREVLRVRPGSPSWAPAVDVVQTASELWVLVAVPGVEADSIEVRLDGARLAVAGTRAVPAPFHRADVHRLEIPRGRFERRVELPSGRYELVQRELRLGCLALHFRKVD
ncbi:MAG: Hsp20/alpha crystallin family protein [Planctomycetota bacterium]